MNSSEDILLSILKYKNPFDIMDILSGNKAYRRYLNDDNFWRDMIYEAYKIQYQGQYPKQELVRLYVQNNYSVNTRARDLPSKYHWFFYMKYFSGEYFKSQFDIISPEKNKSPPGMSSAEERHYSVAYDEGLFNMVLKATEEGKTAVVGYVEGNPILIGIIKDVTTSTLFSVLDPLDDEIWIYNANEPATAESIISESLVPSDLEYLGLTQYSSQWPNRDPELSTQVKEFIQLKLEEGLNKDIPNLAKELAFICRSLPDNS